MNSEKKHSFHNAKSPRELIALLHAYEESIGTDKICALLDREKKVYWTNKKYRDESRYNQVDLKGQEHSFIYSDLHPPSFFEEIERALTKGKTWKGEIMLKARDGKIFWTETTIIPVQDERNENCGFLSVAILIGEKMKKNLAYEKSNFRMYEQVNMAADFLENHFSQCLEKLKEAEQRGAEKVKIADIRYIRNLVKESAAEIKQLRKSAGYILTRRNT
jgi:PAS domain S-box-containing protein